jgi:hypothetical protein
MADLEQITIRIDGLEKKGTLVNNIFTDSINSEIYPADDYDASGTPGSSDYSWTKKTVMQSVGGRKRRSMRRMGPMRAMGAMSRKMRKMMRFGGKKSGRKSRKAGRKTKGRK